MYGSMRGLRQVSGTVSTVTPSRSSIRASMSESEKKGRPSVVLEANKQIEVGGLNRVASGI